jgi:hypothetical protein
MSVTIDMLPAWHLEALRLVCTSERTYVSSVTRPGLLGTAFVHNGAAAALAAHELVVIDGSIVEPTAEGLEVNASPVGGSSESEGTER